MQLFTMALKTNPGVFSSSFSSLLIPSCILVVAFQIYTVKCAATCGTGDNGKVRIEQDPSPLVVDSANPSPQVTLTCVIVSGQPDRAKFFYSITGSGQSLQVQCRENNVFNPNCTVNPSITNGTTTPVKCEAVYSGRADAAFCTMAINEESSNDNTNATITTTVGQATTSQAAGGNEGTTEARAINPTSSGNTTAQADSTGGGETTTAVGKATTVLQVTTKTPPSAMITGGAKTPPTTKMLPVPTPHQAHPSTRKTPPKTQAPTTTHGHKMNNPEASKNKGQRLRVDGYLFFGLACLYFTV